MKSPKKQKRRGRPSYRPDEEARKQVTLMAGFGMKQDEIALVIGVSESTIQRHFKAELAAGKPKADANVLLNLYRQATKDDLRAIPAAIFYSKARRGWHEVQRIIHGFDPEAVNLFVTRVVTLLRKQIPDHCPGCKTNLNLKPKIAESLKELSESMARQLPASEIVPKSP